MALNPSSPRIESPASDVVLGRRLRTLRTSKDWTLEEASKATGLPRSTLSKIENGQMSPTYDALIRLAAALEIDLAELFAQQPRAEGAGRLSVSRAGTGQPHVTPQYHHKLLCVELSRKDMVPFRTRIVARDFGDFDDWSRHDGEEFVFVLSGRVRLYTEFYEPVDLGEGDSWYIDSRMGHAVITLGDIPAEVLWVSTTKQRPTPNAPGRQLDTLANFP